MQNFEAFSEYMNFNFWTSLNKTDQSETLSCKHIMMCALTKCFTALIFDALLFNGFSHDLLTKKSQKNQGICSLTKPQIVLSFKIDKNFNDVQGRVLTVKVPTLGVSPNFEITVVCGLKFHWYFSTLSLKGVFSKPSGKYIFGQNLRFLR